MSERCNTGRGHKGGLVAPKFKIRSDGACERELVI